LGLLATPAFADGSSGEDVTPSSKAPDGQYAVRRGLQAPGGMFAARLLLNANLSDGAIGEPISVTPDLFYGITDRFQLGLVHNGPMGWQSRPGLSLCVTGKDNGCPKVYDNVGLDVMFGLATAPMHLSAHGQLLINRFDPMATSVSLGVAGKLHLGDEAAIFFDPKISIAMQDRDVNDDALYIPVELQYQVGAPMTVKLLTGFSANLSNIGDTYQIPVGIGVVHNLNEHLDIGARFTFDNLLGRQDEGDDRTDNRSAAVLVNFRM
jgi:hypothetical protein